MGELVGKSIDRVDGRLKVVGAARYSAEMPAENPLYGVLVGSTTANGRITTIETQAAESAPGVLKVFTHRNLPRLNPVEKYPVGGAGQSFMPMQADRIYFAGQHIALVIAETLEQAEYAASLIRARYSEAPAISTLKAGLDRRYAPKESLDKTRGNAEATFANATVQIDQTYTTANNYHNPIEPHTTIAAWQGDRLTIYEPLQWVLGAQRTLAVQLGIPQENVHVVSHYVGGAFGCKAFPWAHVSFAAIAARELKRPVKLGLTRPQMYWSVGYRPATVQRMRLSANSDGQLTAILHDAVAQTSFTDDFTEGALAETAHILYACPNVAVTYRLAKVNATTPTVMRGPGETTCLFALDSALDELAEKLQLDPLALRLRNYAEVDPDSGLPWSSKSLRQCYQQAAERFGWTRRNPKPRSMRDGRDLIGWGMATATYPVVLSPAAANVRLSTDGSVVAQSATHELGTGAYTAMAIIAADVLGIPVEQVRFELGDSNLPKSPVAGGSRSTASVGAAVHAAATAVKEELIALAIQDRHSPLYGQPQQNIGAAQGQLYLMSNPNQADSYTDLLKRHQRSNVTAYRESMSPEATAAMKAKVFSGQEAATGGTTAQFGKRSFGVHFAEVRVDPDLGTIRVTRFVSAIGAGRIINRKAAESQIRGGIVMGIGMALMEETISDRHSRIVNANLGEYHIPVNADIPEIDAFFVEEEDSHIGVLGAKGVGEIGIVGVAAAIANAVYHATGKRIRELPITLDKIL